MLSPLLGPQPSFRDLVTAGKQIILVGAGDEFVVRQLHPPALRFLTLQEYGLDLGEGGMIFHKKIALGECSFPPAPAFAIDKIPQHVTDLAGGELALVPAWLVAIDTDRIDVVAEAGITHQDAGLFSVETVGGKFVGGSKSIGDSGVNH